MTDADEAALRERLADYGRSLFARGYGCGTSGNLSVRTARGYLFSPTNAALGSLTADGFSELDADGRHVAGPPATKEAWLHFALYAARPEARAVVHLHSTHAVALSCVKGVDEGDALRPITPYSVMRLGRVARIPYFRPGSDDLRGEVERIAARHHALLLDNHGPIVAAPTLDMAIAAAEEFEEAARLQFLLHGHPHRELTPEQVAELLPKG